LVARPGDRATERHDSVDELLIAGMRPTGLAPGPPVSHAASARNGCDNSHVTMPIIDRDPPMAIVSVRGLVAEREQNAGSSL